MERSAQEIRAAVEQLKLLNSDPVVRDIAFKEQWDECIERMNLKDAEDKGEKAGRKKEKNETAKKLLEQGSDIEFVIKVTGLTRAEVEKLAKERQ